MQILSFRVLLEALAISAIAAGSILIPEPSGPYGVGLTISKMVDQKRQDPFAPTSQKRAIMVSAFYPVLRSQCKKTTQPYMAPATAAFEDSKLSEYGLPSGIFGSFELQLCNSTQSRRTTEFPLLLFSPGQATTRHYYNAIAQAVASSGYIVITIDHPYDADIVEFLDGTLVYATSFIDSDNYTVLLQDPKLTLAVATRRDDAIFVLDELNKESVSRTLIPGVRFKSNQVGMFGHSLGGATSAAAMIKDQRIAGGINLDGGFFGPGYIQKDISRPFLLFSHTGHNQTSDPTWAYVWKHLRGWKRELSLKGSQHYTFSDLPLLVHLLGLGNGSDIPAAVEGMVGSLDGKRSFDIVTKFVGAFYDFVLKGKNSVVKNPNGCYPEVGFLE
ncbi:Alpha/Beta hydrolase protein [Bisporella sp. PMI_857]|nr:Alpha/Beta hydrolase protein [Bisporella sp. PMI_857]